MTQVKACPIEVAFNKTCLQKKWTMTIIRDLFLGEKYFSRFMVTNPGLSAKVLSQRLQEMENEELITKVVVSTTPLKAEYKLATKGLSLNKILYEIAMFGSKFYTKQVFGEDVLDPIKAIDIYGN